MKALKLLLLANLLILPVFATEIAPIDLPSTTTSQVLEGVPTASTSPVVEEKIPGATRADVVLQQDIRKDISALLESKNSTCSPVVKNTKVTMPPTNPKYNHDGKLVKGDWEELWTVDACGSLPEFSVYFMPDGVGGTYFAVEAIE